MQGRERYGAHGGAAVIGPARTRGSSDLIQTDDAEWGWLGLRRPSPVYVAFWMTVSACVVILGIAAARNVSLQGSQFNVRSVLAALLQPASGAPAETTRYTLTSGNLRSRASFASEGEFLKSKSFQTARLAGTILPLALYCKDRQAVELVKSVLGTVTGKDPYHAELMAIGWLARHRKRLGYRPEDCTKQLPQVIVDLRGRT